MRGMVEGRIRTRYDVMIAWKYCRSLVHSIWVLEGRPGPHDTSYGAYKDTKTADLEEEQGVQYSARQIRLLA